MKTSCQPDVNQEKEIFLLFKHGDKNAFEQIYKRYAGRLTVKLIQLLKSEELAQDVLQDVFLKIWETRESINPDLSFGAFIYKIAKNLSLNSFRRALLEQNFQANIKEDLNYNPIEDLIFRKETHSILENALKELTPRQREVFVLHKIEGKSYKEIADTLQISASAINHHLQLANKQLREILKPHMMFIISLLIPCLIEFYN